MAYVLKSVKCCFTFTETVDLLEPRTSTSTFTQLLSSGVRAVRGT